MADSKVTVAVNALKKALPKGRVSADKHQSLFNTTFGFDGGFTALDGNQHSRSDALDKIRGYVRTDEDVKGSRRDLIAISNFDWEISYTGDERAVDEAKEVTDALEQRIFAHAGGLDGLVNHQIGEVFESACSSCEWFPDKTRSMVEDVAIVGDVELKREDGVWCFYQKPTTGFFTRQAITGIKLNPLTYKYMAFDPQGDSPYGMPIPEASLGVLQRKADIDFGVNRIIKLMGKGALVTVTVPKPTPEELDCSSEDDPKYIEELGKFMNAVADLVVQGQEEQIYFAYETEKGKPDIKVHALGESGKGIREIELGNLFRVWSGVGSTAFLRGYMESTTESLAKTVWMMMSSLAKNVQPIVKAQIDFGLNLNLRLHGIPAQAQFNFADVPNPYAEQDARADLTIAQADDILLKQMGLDYLPRIYRRWGILPNKTREELPDDMRIDKEPTPPKGVKQ